MPYNIFVRIVGDCKIIHNLNFSNIWDLNV